MVSNNRTSLFPIYIYIIYPSSLKMIKPFIITMLPLSYISYVLLLHIHPVHTNILKFTAFNNHTGIKSSYHEAKSIISHIIHPYITFIHTIFDRRRVFLSVLRHNSSTILISTIFTFNDTAISHRIVARTRLDL